MTDKIIPFLGGFHTLIVKLKILHKKYGALGMREWWVDSGAIVEGSSIKAAEGSHYFRSVRCHKQSFEALLRYKILKYTDVDNYNEELKEAAKMLRSDTNESNLEKLMNLDQFKVLADD